MLLSLTTKFTNISADKELEGFRSNVHELFSRELAGAFEEFKHFMEDLVKRQDTIQFWYKFVLKDCFAYLSLFIGIRYRNWKLRTSGIKLMAAVFSAFDRPIYQRLVPQHLLDIQTLPEPVLAHLQNGGFSIRLTPSEWHSVAVDECHEMKVNKDAKLAVIRPSESKMVHLSNYLPFRSACLNNLMRELFPEREKSAEKFDHNPTSKDKKVELNVQSMMEQINTHGMFHQLPDNQGLYNFLQNKKAAPEQAYDLLNFRDIGQKGFENYTSSKLLKLPSTNAPVRKKRLYTFTQTKTAKQRVRQVERERKITQRLLKRQLAWVAKHGNSDDSVTDMLYGPISPLPRALVDSNGLPYKGSKSNTTTYLEKRYKQASIIISAFPPGWVPDTIILEGMFMIQTSPIPTMSYMTDYVQYLLSRFVRPHFVAGAKEVHVLFDNPGSQSETPKELEQMRRDKASESQTSTCRHECISFHSNCCIPDKWRNVLDCRICKKALTVYIAEEMLQLITRYIDSNQEFITNVAQSAYSTTTACTKVPQPTLWTNADEADLRVWLHCVHSQGQRKLIFSPDTDVYHIGLSAISLIPDTQIIVQLSKDHTHGARFLCLNTLLDALSNDPDLADILPNLRPQAMQSLYISTGCDYVSFFTGIGKASFLSTFFQHASFIAGGREPPGSIGEFSLDAQSPGMLSFLRLVGCAYFRKHSSAFELHTPEALFHSTEGTTMTERHEKWLSNIRRTVWQRADSESHNMPSTEALKLHWKRAVWIVAMWHSSTANELDLPRKLLMSNVRALYNSIVDRVCY